MLDAFIGGLLAVLSWPAFPLMLVGILIAVAVGLLPGINGAATLGIMLPFVFGLEPIAAFALLLGMISVTLTFGDVTSVLFGVPGESSSAATIIDGHAMARNGEAGRALGAVLMSSFIGAIIGAFALAAFIPIVRPVILSFASPELLGLAVLGLVFVGAISSRKVLKGLLAAGFGLMLSMVGLDPIQGMPRYTFGTVHLWDGVGLVAATVGLFAIPEIVELWRRGRSISEKPPSELGHITMGIRDTFVHWKLTLRSSVIGTFFGMIPGLGPVLGQWVAYGHAVQSASDKSRFGKEGDVRGVLGPGAANNSTLGGSLIPTVAFGVPGTVVAAILLGALLIQGIQPGPEMLTTHLTLTFSLVWLVVLANIIAVPLCILALRPIVKLTYIRGSLLIPPILLMILIGGYADGNSLFSMGMAIAFGLLGVVMVALEWPRPPLILGLILGTLIEKYAFISYERYGLSFLTRPVLIGVLLLIVVVLVAPLLRRGRAAKRERKAVR